MGINETSPSAGVRTLLLEVFHTRPKLCATVILLAILLPLCGGVSMLLLIPILESSEVIATPAADGSLRGLFREGLQFLGVSRSLGALLAAFLVLTTTYAALMWFQVVVTETLRASFVLRYQKRLYRSVGRMQWQVFQTLRSQDIAHALSIEAERLLQGLNALVSLISNVALVAVYTILSLCLSPKMTILAAFICLMLAPMLVRRVRSARGMGHQMTELTRRTYRDVQDQLAGVKEAKVFGAEEMHASQFAALANHMKTVRYRFEVSKGGANFLFQTCTSAMLCLTIYVGVAVLQIPAANLFLLIVIAARIAPRAMKAQHDYQNVLHALPAYSTMTTLQNKCAHFTEVRGGHECSTSILTNVAHIDLVDVCFRYHRDQDAWVLRELNMAIPVGKITAIVGDSGSGKSTLADMLLGLLAPEKGSINVNGVDIHEQLTDWRNLVGYVPQETFLLHDTLKNNLLWGNPSATDDEIREALKLASADDLVAGLPAGLQTVVGERGSRLSGGERQRISLARALLRKPSVLILDEATSALDRKNAEQIGTSLTALSGRMTVIVIAHIQSAIEIADHVIVLNDGTVLEQGALENLAHSKRLVVA